MAELEDLQKQLAELTAQLQELKTKSDADALTLKNTQADLASAREANAVLVSRLPNILQDDTKTQEAVIDTRSEAEKQTDAINAMVDAVYADRYTPKEAKS